MASSFWSQHVNPTPVPQFNWQGMGYTMEGLKNGFSSLSKLGDTLQKIDQSNADRILRERMLGLQNQDQMLQAVQDGSLLEGIKGRVDADTLAKVDYNIRNQALHDANREKLLDTQDLNKNAEAIAALYRNKQNMNPEEFYRALAKLTTTPEVRANTLAEANKIGNVKGVADEAKTFQNQQRDELATNIAAALKTLDDPQEIANTIAYITNNFAIDPEVVELVRTKFGDTLKDVSPLSIVETPGYAATFEKDSGKRIVHGLLNSLGTTSGIQRPYGSYAQFAGATTTPVPTPAPATTVETPATAGAQPASINKAADLLGSVSAKEESNSNPGSISSGTGDLGGRSYGAFQFSSKMGTAQDYVKNSKYKERFDGLEVGSKEFNEAWKKLAKEDPEGFYADQQVYAEKNFYGKTKDDLTKKGIDLSNRGRAIQELLFSTGISFGSSAPALISKALNGKNVDQMSDADIISAVQNHIKDNVSTLYKSSPKYQQGRADRTQREAERLIAMAAEEAPTRGVSEAPKGMPFTGSGWGEATDKSYADGKLKPDDGSLQKYMDEYSKTTGYTWRNEPGSRFFADELNYQLRKDPKARELLEYGNIDPNANLVTKSQTQQAEAKNGAEGKIQTAVKPQQYIKGEASAAAQIGNTFSNKVANGTVTFDDAETAYSLIKEGYQNQRVVLARRMGVPASVLDNVDIVNKGVHNINTDLKNLDLFKNYSDEDIGTIVHTVNSLTKETGCTPQEALLGLIGSLDSSSRMNWGINAYNLSNETSINEKEAKKIIKVLKSKAYRRENHRLKQLNNDEAQIDASFAGIKNRKDITSANATKYRSSGSKLTEAYLNDVAFQAFNAKLNKSVKNFTN